MALDLEKLARRANEKSGPDKTAQASEEATKLRAELATALRTIEELNDQLISKAAAAAAEQRAPILPQDSLSPSETDAFRTKAELLQRELDFVKEEVKDHVAALIAFQEKIGSLLKHMSAGGSRTDFAREQVVIKMRLKAAHEALETYLEIITPDTQN